MTQNQKQFQVLRQDEYSKSNKYPTKYVDNKESVAKSSKFKETEQGMTRAMCQTQASVNSVTVSVSTGGVSLPRRRADESAYKNKQTNTRRGATVLKLSRKNYIKTKEILNRKCKRYDWTCEPQRFCWHRLWPGKGGGGEVLDRSRCVTIWLSRRNLLQRTRRAEWRSSSVSRTHARISRANNRSIPVKTNRAWSWKIKALLWFNYWLIMIPYTVC